MKKIFYLFFLVLAFAIKAHSQSYPNNPVDPAIVKNLKGAWTNQLASILTINDIDKNSGLISGTYFYSGITFPLIGWVNTSATDTNLPNHVVVVSFSVRWGQAGKVTAWNGYWNNENIVGQWTLSSPNSKEIWDRILVGQDIFNKMYGF